MLVVNFSHPLTSEQREQLATHCHRVIDRIVEVKLHFRQDDPFGPQAVDAIDSAGLTNEEWQTLPLVVVPPALAPIACACLAELHGRIGYFPTIARLRPRPDATPPVFDVAEVVNLQHLRDQARSRR